MRGFTGALVAAAVALAVAGAARSALIVGVNDSAPLIPSELGWFYPTMGSEGLTVDALTLRWDETAPTTIPNQAQVAQAIAGAAANGVTVELDLYPLHSAAFTGGTACAPSSDPQACGNTAEITAFAGWTAQVAQAFPTVHEFVVMNECNQPLFINPQWDSAGQNQSAEICGRALAASYTALKAVSSQNFVWGVGLSPRGNDNPSAASDASTSPVAFLGDLGSWFRAFAAATGRTTPLMDGLDFHPYPIPQSQPFAQGYQDQNDASVSNLPRIYQAFYQGFNGTPQRTIGQQAGGGLPVSLNEVGVQTAETGVQGYVGTETSANSNGGVIGQYATPAYQATWYVDMLDLVACDPNVRLVNIYHLIDEASLAGWQSGLFDINRNAKQAAGAVHDWIASTGGRCLGPMHPWTPPGVAAVSSAPPRVIQSPGRILVATAGRIRVFDSATFLLRRVIAPFGSSYTGPLSLALREANGVSEVAAGEGSAPSLVRLFNGKTWRQLASFRPFGASFGGGVTVAFGDLGGNGHQDLVVGSGPGMPAEVKVYPTSGSGLVERLVPFGPGFQGGVSVAAGPLGKTGPDDLIVGSGPGMPSAVKVYAGDTTTVVESLSPFAASFKGGVVVAAGNLEGTGNDDVLVGTGSGITSVVRAYRGATATRLWSVDALGPMFSGGITLATFAPGTGVDDVVVGAGNGGGAQVKLLSGRATFAGTFLGSTGSTAVAVAAG